MIVQHQRDIAAKVRNALCCHLCRALGFGQDERALQRGLGVVRQALCGPVGIRRVQRACLGDVFGDGLGVRVNTHPARITNGGVGFKRLLHHGAQQAGEIGQLALQNLGAKVDVGEHPLTRVGNLLIRRAGEQAAGHLGPITCGLNRQLFLALEVVEEAALAHARRVADVVHRGGGVALGAKHLQGGVQQLGFGGVGLSSH